MCSGLVKVQFSLNSINIFLDADINIKSHVDGATPLHVTARYNQAEATKLLLQRDADIKATMSNGQTALHIACRKGHVKIAQVWPVAKFRWSA